MAEGIKKEKKLSTPALVIRYGFAVLGILLLILDIEIVSGIEPYFVVMGFVLFGIFAGVIFDKFYTERSREYDF